MRGGYGQDGDKLVHLDLKIAIHIAESGQGN